MMTAIKGVYRDGTISLQEAAPLDGPVEVLVVFPELPADPWDRILAEPVPRASFLEFAARIKKEIAEGKTKPLNLDDL
jgi:hypothetical protein